jgi:hypothetical protein
VESRGASATVVIEIAESARQELAAGTDRLPTAPVPIF